MPRRDGGQRGRGGFGALARLGGKAAHRALLLAGLAAAAATPALAGGVERGTQSVAMLFEPGRVLEFSTARVAPDVSGIQRVPFGPISPVGSDSGDMAGDYTSFGLALKFPLGDKLDMALILDEPIGADLDYSSGTPGYLYGINEGSQAKVDTMALTALLRYRMGAGLSLIGGLRAQRTEGRVALFSLPPAVPRYQMHTSTAVDFGYVLGVAWEKPEIAARVALTYNSAIKHDFTAYENFAAAPTAMTVTVPQSVNLEFQTGVAKDTLLFGAVRWVNWKAFEIAPQAYVAAFGEPLVSHDGDTVTYTLGLGHRFSPSWSGAILASVEQPVGGFAGNLGPTDGARSLGLAASWTRGAVKVTGGLRYYWLGDTTTRAPGTTNVTFGDFAGNRAVAAGLRIAYSF